MGRLFLCDPKSSPSNSLQISDTFHPQYTTPKASWEYANAYFFFTEMGKKLEKR